MRRAFSAFSPFIIAGTVLFAVLTMALSSASAAATITVNSTADDTLTNLNGNGTCDLREAIEAANTNAAVGECTAGNGTDTIVFDSALTAESEAYVVVTTADSGEDNGEFGPTAFSISSPVIIQGPSGENGLILWGSFGNNEQRLFHVTTAGDLTLQNLTLTRGTARGGDGGGGNAGGGGAAGMGGAVFNEGTLNVVRSTFSDNTAYGGHGHPNQSDYGSGGGGGVATDGQDEQNDPGGDGGAPNAGSGGSAGGDATDGGTGGGGGGGGGNSCACTHTAGHGGNGGFGGAGGGGGYSLATGGGTGGTGGNGGDGGFGGGAGGAGSAESFGQTPVAGSPGTGGFGGGDGESAGTMSANVGGAGGGGAGMGGAIFNHGGTVNVESSTFSGNEAWGGSSFQTDGSTFDDGGPGDGYGGAIFNRNGTVNVYNSTIVSNTVVAGEGSGSGAHAGAGVYNLGDSATATLVLSNTVVANSVGANSDIELGDFNYTIVMTQPVPTSDVVGNTINSGTNSSSGPNNQIESQSGFAGSVVSSADPQLGPLQDNTGPTDTHAPVPGSVVIDAGLCGGEATDQRGVIRPTDGEPNGSVLCDIGAVEFDPNLDPVDPSGGVDHRIGDMLRISDMGPDGNTSYGANRPAVAYNSTDHEYLVVWYGDDDSGSLVDNEFEVYGQRYDAATGAEISTDFRISHVGTDGDADYDAFYPRVAYNATDNEYLVVWYGDDDTASLVDNEFEIFGQRLNAATGTEVGDNDFRISDMGTNGDTLYGAQYPDVVWNATENEYLVVWHGDDDSGSLVDNEFEIFGQIINAATGAEVDTDFRISEAGTDGDANFDAQNVRVGWNSTDNQYLVVWQGDDDTAPLVDNETEIFGQRIDGATGNETGDSDFRISDMGPNGDTAYRAGGFSNPPHVAYNAVDNEYLVTWWGDDDTGSLVDNEYEIFGQRLNAATGAEVGDNDFRISDAGLDGNTSYGAGQNSLAYDATNHEYVVVWHADEFSPPLVNDNEFEIFGQRLSATTGAEVGQNDFRISVMGPDGDIDFDGLYPDVSASSTNEEFLIVWQGDHSEAPLINDETEVFAQRYGVTPTDPELSLSKTASNSMPTSGDTLTYTVVISNSGNADATGAIVSDTIPAGLSFVNGSTTLEPAGAGTTGNAPTLVSGLTITTGETVTVTYEAMVTAASGQITNTVGITSTEVTGAVTDTATITVLSDVYVLSVTTEGNGSGSVSSTPAGIDCGSDCTEMYTAGTVVTLNASYDPATTTLAWGGACSAATGDSCDVTMDQAHNVTATFTLKSFPLNVTVSGSGTGSVSSTPAGIDCGSDCTEMYTAGTMVTLTATPGANSTFSGWSGACSGSGACQVTMDESKQVTATFIMDVELDYALFMPMVLE